jgi:hypothetical protein
LRVSKLGVASYLTIVLWGLDAEGNFLTGPKDAVTLYEQVRNKLFKKDEVNVKEAVLMDLKRIHDAVREENSALKEAHAPKYEIGKKLLFLFQCDLLPGISGKILELKGSRDSSKVKHVSFRAKVAAWAFLFLMDAGMLFYILLFALTQTGPRQNAWFQSFALWLVVEILLVSTAIVFITHILVPSLIMKDITQIKRRLMDNIRDFNDKVNATGDMAALVTSAEGAEGVSFNAANYLFVSTRLAREFPELKESKIILQFSTPWPRQSYLHIQNVSKKYSKKFSALTRSASILLIFFVGNFLSVPPSVQDMVVQMTSTTAIGYIVLVHVQLYEIFPALVILPALLLAGLAHFAVQSSKSDAKIKLARLFPARNKAHKVQQDPTSPAAAEKSAAYAAGNASSSATAIVGVQADGQVGLFGADQASDSDFGDSGSDSEAAVRVAIASAAPGAAAHKTRRQSIQSGLDLLHVAHRHTAQRADLEKLTSSGASPEHNSEHAAAEDEDISLGDSASDVEDDGAEVESDASDDEDSDGSYSDSSNESVSSIGIDCQHLHVALGTFQQAVRTLERRVSGPAAVLPSAKSSVGFNETSSDSSSSVTASETESERGARRSSCSRSSSAGSARSGATGTGSEMSVILSAASSSRPQSSAALQATEAAPVDHAVSAEQRDDASVHDYSSVSTASPQRSVARTANAPVAAATAEAALEATEHSHSDSESASGSDSNDRMSEESGDEHCGQFTEARNSVSDDTSSSVDNHDDVSVSLSDASKAEHDGLVNGRTVPGAQDGAADSDGGASDDTGRGTESHQSPGNASDAEELGRADSVDEEDWSVTSSLEDEEGTADPTQQLQVEIGSSSTGVLPVNESGNHSVDVRISDQRKLPAGTVTLPMAHARTTTGAKATRKGATPMQPRSTSAARPSASKLRGPTAASALKGAPAAAGKR